MEQSKFSLLLDELSIFSLELLLTNELSPTTLWIPGNVCEVDEILNGGKFLSKDVEGWGSEFSLFLFNINLALFF